MSTAPIERRGAALFWLFFSTVIWGSSFFLVKGGIAAIARALAAAAPGTGAEAHAPALFILLRFALATAAFALFPGALAELRSSAQARRDSLLMALPFALGFALQVYGLAETTATVSAFLTSTYVLFVPIFVFAFEREAPPPRLVAGAGLAVAGIALLTLLGHPRPATAAGAFGRGEVLSILCAIAFSLQIYWTDVFTRRTGAAALSLGSLAATAALAALGLASMPAGRAALAPPAIAAAVSSREALFALAYTAFGSTVLALYLMYRYQRAVSPSRATILYAVEPAAAAAFAVLFASERLTPLGFAGCGMILAGNVVAELGRIPKLRR